MIVCDMSGDKLEIEIEGKSYRFCFPVGCAPIRINKNDDEIKAPVSKYIWNVLQAVKLSPVSISFGEAFCSSRKSKLYGKVMTAIWSCPSGCMLFWDVERTKEEILSKRSKFIRDVELNGGTIVEI